MRLDLYMLKKGLAESRARAQALIAEGAVTVNGVPASKASQKTGEGALVEVREDVLPWVSRAALNQRRHPPLPSLPPHRRSRPPPHRSPPSRRLRPNDLRLRLLVFRARSPSPSPSLSQLLLPPRLHRQQSLQLQHNQQLQHGLRPLRPRLSPQPPAVWKASSKTSV